MKPEERPLISYSERKDSLKTKLNNGKILFSSEEEEDVQQTIDLELCSPETEILKMGFDYLFPLDEKEVEESERGPPYFPFDRIYEQPFDVTALQVDMLIPGYPISVKFLGVERHVGPKILNPYLYTIRISHGNFVWITRVRFNQLKHLHKTLKKFVSTSKEFTSPDFSIKALSSTFPRFPKVSDAAVPPDQVGQMAKLLEDYLNQLLKYAMYRNHRDTMELLQISPLSFVPALGCKGKEGMVRIRSGGHLVGNCCIRICRYTIRHCRLWRRYWMIARDNFIVYIDPQNGRVKFVLLMDSAFTIKSGYFDTGFHYGIVISNYSRELLVDFESKRRAEEWETCLKELAVTSGSDFTQTNRYGSFAPIRRYTKASWFVDGSKYFSCLADLLDSATEEIFIASWWLTPEIYLKRPACDKEEWRLDVLLKRKAEEGVKVFVLLYKEVELALNTGSSYAKAILLSLHPNIKVIRHPDHLKTYHLFWTHHEKIVIIDQSHAFIGGLDPCFGRWDDWNHRLDDLGEGDKTEEVEAMPVSQLETSLIMRKAVTEMFLLPKRKQTSLKPSSKWHKVLQKRDALIRGKDKLGKDKPSRLARIRNRLSHRHAILDKKWPGKDYANFVHKEVTGIDSPMEDLIDRRRVPRLPWHDIGAVIVGAAARDVSRHFIQRWNSAKFSKKRHNDNYPWLLPKSYADASDVEPHSKLTELYLTNCQICRSACDWSAGVRTCEQSIHAAYVDCIKSSKHYVYIENQFFITHPPGDNDIYNGIWEAIYNRILTAHTENQVFKVYVVIPMLPGFEGDITSDKPTVMRTVAYYTYASISKGSTSLLERLATLIPDPTEYITFFSLRTYGKLDNTYVSEMIYIHSKILIVDDRTAIIGSANINDRSLLGRRDSEMAVVVNDYEMIESTMNGERYKAGQFTISLRKRLFAEHLGLTITDPILDDPVCDIFFREVLMKTAFLNTALHEKIFRCVPTNEIVTYRQLYEYTNHSSLIDIDPSKAIQMLKQIKGFLIIFPLYFLREENMEPSGVATSTVLPSSCFT